MQKDNSFSVMKQKQVFFLVTRKRYALFYEYFCYVIAQEGLLKMLLSLILFEALFRCHGYCTWDEVHCISREITQS